jgi:hypothetical protein
VENDLAGAANWEMTGRWYSPVHGRGMQIFKARTVGVDRNDFGVTVGLARDSSCEGSEDVFILQRSSVDAIDAPGIAGVYIEVPIQRYVAYGGIIDATLCRDSFEVRLNDETAIRFGGASGFRGEFSIDEAAFDDLRDALRFVFRGCACYKETT